MIKIWGQNEESRTLAHSELWGWLQLWISTTKQHRLHACCSQPDLMILESSTHALFLYNYTCNTSRMCERRVWFIHVHVGLILFLKISFIVLEFFHHTRLFSGSGVLVLTWILKSLFWKSLCSTLMLVKFIHSSGLSIWNVKISVYVNYFVTIHSQKVYAINI